VREREYNNYIAYNHLIMMICKKKIEFFYLVDEYKRNEEGMSKIDMKCMRDNIIYVNTSKSQKFSHCILFFQTLKQISKAV